MAECLAVRWICIWCYGSDGYVGYDGSVLISREPEARLGPLDHLRSTGVRLRNSAGVNHHHDVSSIGPRIGQRLCQCRAALELPRRSASMPDSVKGTHGQK